VVPYFGYARQDRRVRSARVPISAKVVADMMVTVGVDRVLTVDLHAEQIQGFSPCPVDNIYGSPVLNDDIQACEYENVMVVSPDIGGVVRARAIAKQLNDAELAIIDKRRPKANETEVMNIIGNVEGRVCLLVDDMVDTAGTLCNAANALKERGATKVAAYCTHAVLSGRPGQRPQLPARRAGGNGHDSAVGRSQDDRQDPPAHHRRPARRVHPPRVQRGVDQRAVLLGD
jgi:ribose-phosphate pyrophosphokinase